ncbi:antitoxin Xre/MbcA/ParS toxin-binding domain-containing protein [Dyella sp. Tek66A03]|uniref:antitoxin Xre/MbcA/ParS toxin-binding domain-containing protein n=1 Tax=Dyella sp. Tek66A03 TaxID=3458298 RepID=UPI00403EEC89
MSAEMKRQVGLVEAVELLVKTRGELAGFDAAAWVTEWIAQPLPALGGKRPAEFLASDAGYALLVRLLEQSANGVVA